MFENMMKHEKAWEKFLALIYDNYDFIYEDNCFYLDHDSLICYSNDMLIEDVVILSIMPFFFDEHGLFIEVNMDYIYGLKYTVKIKDMIVTGFKDRQSSLIFICEKAFEILEGVLNGNSSKKN